MVNKAGGDNVVDSYSLIAQNLFDCQWWPVAPGLFSVWPVIKNKDSITSESLQKQSKIWML